MTIKAILVSCALALSAMSEAAQEYTPYIDEDLPKNLYWGDTDLHSSFSMDANIMGNTALPPEAAFRFARGEQVTANNGMQVKLGGAA